MRECLSDLEIRVLTAGGPPPRDHLAIQQHLISCNACRSRLEIARQLKDGDATTVRVPSDHAAASPPSPRDDKAAPPPIQLEGYDVLERIQGGAQGVVFKAVQRSTSRLVAVKILPHEETATDREKQRFEREVSLAASLRHPNIVTIYDSGLTSGRFFFAMEYVHGRPLDDYAREAGLSRDEKLGLFARVCDAVAHAHQQNIVHRDLKPGNILVDARGEPHVLDFGLAKSAGAAMLAQGQAPLTLTSQFMGTLAYASPEQTLGDPTMIDRRSDVYALGVILFELLTGAFPYPMSGDFVATFEAIRNHEPRKPSEVAGGSGINRDLDTIVLRALAKEPSRRYQSAEELAADVHHYLVGEPIAARRDSMGYVFGIRSKAAVRRHPALTRAIVMASAALLAAILVTFVARLWPGPARWFEFAAAGPPPGVDTTAGAFDNIRIVAVTNHTQDVIGEVARDAGLSGVTSENWTSARRVHGRLMERLAAAGTRAVVWDFAFKGPSEYDADLVRGIQALKTHDPPVGAVIGLWNWNLNDRGQPAEISPEILRALPVWGGVTINTDDQSMWKVDLVLKQAGKAPMISLPLAAYCAWRHPNTNPSATLDSWNVKASVEYREEKPEVLQSVTKYDTVPLSAVRAPENIRPSDKEMGIFADSLVGYYALRLMPREPLERATTPYEDVMAMNKDQLAEWARGKLILVGDFRVDEQGKGDWYVAPDSKPLWGPQAQALAIDSLLRDVMPARYPHPLADYLMLLGGAALGVFAAGRRFGSAAMRLLAAAGLAALLVGACLLGFRLSGYLCQPLGAIIALALAFCAWLWFDPLYQHPRTEALPHRRTAS